MDYTKYFAALSPRETSEELLSRVGEWGRYAAVNSYNEKIRRSWFYYYGSFYERGNEHRLSFAGEQGELVQFPINHYKNIGTHLLNMITANRPALQARATNTDYKSLTQTYLANGLLDYYLREKNLEDYLQRAAEYAIVFGEGWLKLDWDATAGEVYDYEVNDQTGTKIPIYEGDIKYSNLFPMDVIRDSSKETSQHDWLLTRTYKNRFALAAKYPELEDEIKRAPSKDDLDHIKFNSIGGTKTDDIAVYEFYHVRNDALQDGRYMIFISSEAVLYDGPLPYKEIPVYRMAASDLIGSPYGYTVLFDLLPIQEAINLLYSVIISNQNAFGVQSILVPKGADMNLEQISGGLNILEYDQTRGKPESMNLTQTPTEIFKMLEKLENTMETISGINSVTRGNPEASLKSGTALALIQAQAVQFSSILQRSYIRLSEAVGTAIIKMLQDYAKVPRVAAIVGKSNKSYIKEFSGKDLSSINRVIVELSNPLSKTTAGRVEIANNLLQMKVVKNVEEYFTVLNTGKLETMIEGEQSHVLLIRDENERMMEGEHVTALILDNHKLHIQEHKALLDDTDLRRDPTLVANVLQHVQEHVNLLSSPNASLLVLTDQQPIPPQAPPQEQLPAPTNVQQASGSLQGLAQPLPTGIEPAQNLNTPNLPTPPPPFENLPISPGQTGNG